MNCCDDYGKCTRGADCPARTEANTVAATCSHFQCLELGVCNCPTLVALPVSPAVDFQDPDEQSPARDVVPDYVSSWEWIGYVLQAGLAASAAVAIVIGGLGFAIGRWML